LTCSLKLPSKRCNQNQNQNQIFIINLIDWNNFDDGKKSLGGSAEPHQKLSGGDSMSAGRGGRLIFRQWNFQSLPAFPI
jgi:hypothetical protein